MDDEPRTRWANCSGSICSGTLTIMIRVKYPPSTVWLQESMLPPNDSTALLTAATIPGWSLDMTVSTKPCGKRVVIWRS